MKTECARISEQLRRAFTGGSWHGPSLKELLADVTVEQAAAHPVKGAHSIWELVLHIHVWEKAALGAAQGVAIAEPLPDEIQWPAHSVDADSWAQTLSMLFVFNEALCRTIEKFGDERLAETVPGREYDFHFIFNGVIQHSLYHAGQIVLLRKSA